METVVRIAEQATSNEPGHVLAAVGLGSCIGLALLDRAHSIAGLAHVILPDAGPAGSNDRDACKYADTAVPALVDSLVRVGARETDLEAVLVGGARMFSFAGSHGTCTDLGHRNEAAVVEALAKVGVPVRARATGGTRGRTVRVRVGRNEVAVREAGGIEAVIYSTGGGPTS